MTSSMITLVRIISVHAVWRRPHQSHQDDQGGDVDQEPDWLEKVDMGDLVVRHVLHWAKEDEEVCPAGEKSSDNSRVLHSL